MLFTSLVVILSCGYTARVAPRVGAWIEIKIYGAIPPFENSGFVRGVAPRSTFSKPVGIYTAPTPQLWL